MNNPGVVIKVELTGGQKFAKMLMPETFKRHMKNHIPRATGQNAAFAAKKMRQLIQAANFKPNAALTIMIKGSSKPLVDHGDLFGAITHKKIDDYTGWVGLERNNPAAKLAELLHDGGVIPVTPAMRGMFFFLWKASNGDMSPSKLTGRAAELFARQPTGWYPLSENTTAIVIPGRPFVKQTIEDEALKEQMTKNWTRAVQFIFRDMKREFFGSSAP